MQSDDRSVREGSDSSQTFLMKMAQPTGELTHPSQQQQLQLQQQSFQSIFGGASDTTEEIDTETDSNHRRPHSFGAAATTPAKLANKNVAPFLVKHIPEQYGPLGSRRTDKLEDLSSPNSKFCYRHRPDLKCRRQADEPSMDKLQRVGFLRACHVSLS